jgi:hypothetical protein
MFIASAQEPKSLAPDGAKPAAETKSPFLRIEVQGFITRARVPGGGGEGWVFL